MVRSSQCIFSNFLWVVSQWQPETQLEPSPELPKNTPCRAKWSSLMYPWELWVQNGKLCSANSFTKRTAGGVSTCYFFHKMGVLHQPLTGLCGATESEPKSPQRQMAFKEYIQLHVCVIKGRLPVRKCWREKETLLVAWNWRVFKMGKQHVSGSLSCTAVLWGMSSVCVRRSRWGPKVIPHDSWLQVTITISKALGSIESPEAAIFPFCKRKKGSGEAWLRGQV